MLELFMSLMMARANANISATTTPGEYYEVSNVQYNQAENKTYSIWSRYRVQGAYNAQGLHFHVEITDGNKAIGELVKEAQSRSDKPIIALP